MSGCCKDVARRAPASITAAVAFMTDRRSEMEARAHYTIATYRILLSQRRY